MTDDSAPDALPDAPQPRAVRFFGMSWVSRGADYRLRRAGVALGALLAAAAAVLVLWLAVSGVLISGTGDFVTVLVVLAVLVCSVLAALRTWRTLAEGKSELTGWMADEKALGPIMVIGFVGAVAAYFVRSLIEAPGEARERARHEAATAEYERRRSSRSGRPDVRRRTAKRKSGR